ncbi:hypothetical protein P7K49_010387 [Saguinus oedipus]|uniref:Uncharacterized protein n=1 Tax=Saguinus oedipus TaxID=9490 RepID=A0ABQ9VMM4_SAGOE|nr:hypothetical protein P7K49_010387 [Saguinus oedipus]
MGSREPAEPLSPGDATQDSARPAYRHGLLKHSREFLDFFWDIAKPEQETRLVATEKLLEYLRARPKVERRVWGRGRALPDKEAAAGPGIWDRGTWSRTWMPRCAGVCSFLSLFNASVRLVPQGSEMKYALKRLITGLGVGRETARPCYSLALAQVRWCSWQAPSHAGENCGVYGGRVSQRGGGAARKKV